jgi:hypothetical protein
MKPSANGAGRGVGEWGGSGRLATTDPGYPANFRLLSVRLDSSSIS